MYKALNKKLEFSNKNTDEYDQIKNEIGLSSVNSCYQGTKKIEMEFCQFDKLSEDYKSTTSDMYVFDENYDHLFRENEELDFENLQVENHIPNRRFIPQKQKTNDKSLLKNKRPRVNFMKNSSLKDAYDCVSSDEDSNYDEESSEDSSLPEEAYDQPPPPQTHSYKVYNNRPRPMNLMIQNHNSAETADFPLPNQS